MNKEITSKGLKKTILQLQQNIMYEYSCLWISPLGWVHSSQGSLLSKTVKCWLISQLFVGLLFQLFLSFCSLLYGLPNVVLQNPNREEVVWTEQINTTERGLCLSSTKTFWSQKPFKSMIFWPLDIALVPPGMLSNLLSTKHFSLIG